MKGALPPLTGLVWLATTLPLPAQGRGLVHLDRFSGEARLTGEFRDERRQNSFFSLEEREKTLREDLKLRFAGNVYHPRLLEYDLETTVGLEQQGIDGNGVQNRSINASNLGYDLHTRIFWRHPYSAHIYSTRQETRTRQTFFETTEATIMETGAELFARKWILPTRAHYHHYTYRGRGLDNNDETRDNFKLDGRRFERTHRIQYAVEYNDIDITNFDTHFTDFDALLSDALNFGAADRNVLSSSIRFREQNGDFDNEALIGGLGLGLDWGHGLKSKHDLTFDHFRVRNQGASLNETWRHTSLVTYRLYSSLDLRLGFDGQRTDQGDAAVNRAGTTGEVEYRKKTVFGDLHLRYANQTYWQNEQSQDRPVGVVDESHTYVPGVPLTLDNFGVDLASVVVTDATGLTVYQRGLDYVLTVFAGRVRIDVTPGSRILPNQVILVDYVFQPRPEQRFRSASNTFGFGFSFFEHVDLELGWSQTNQKLLGGIDSGTLQDTTRKFARLGVHQGEHLAAVEYEDLDSVFTPFERWRMEIGSAGRLAPWLSWRAGASTFESRFKDQSGKERGTTVTGQLVAPVSDSFHFDLRSEWRNVDYRTDRGTGILFEANAVHTFRKTEVRLQLRFSNEEFDVATDQRVIYAMLTVSRRF